MKQRFIASGRAFSEFHEYIQGEDSCALYTSYAHPRHQMGRFLWRVVRRRNDYHRVVRLTKEKLGEKREERGWERQYGKIPSGKQLLQLNRNRENSVENPKPQYKLQEAQKHRNHPLPLPAGAQLQGHR